MPDYHLSVAHENELHDLFVEVGDGATVDAVVEALSKQGYKTPLSIDGQSFRGQISFESTAVRNGATIYSASANLKPSAPLRPDRYLVVVAGPAAGQWVLLPSSGIVLLGREARILDLSDDPRLSKRHAELHLHVDGRVGVLDLGSANGTVVDDTAVGNDLVELHTDGFLLVGDSVFRVVTLTKDDFAVLSGEGPTVPFQRRFRNQRPNAVLEVEFPRDLTSTSSGAGSSWWRSLVPLASGAVMALITGQLVFLFVIAIAPIVYVVEAYRQKSGQAKKAREEAASFRQAQDAANQRLSTARQAFVNSQRIEYPAAGESVLRTVALHRRLWERLPSDPDFSLLTIGVGTKSSPVSIVKEHGRAPDADFLRLVPITVTLAEVGSLAIVGAGPKTRKVTTGLLLNLAATHAPDEMVFWLFSGEHVAEEWNWFRWLPSVWSEAGTARIAVSASGRNALLSDLRSTFEEREERQDDHKQSLPLHVIVIDGGGFFTPGQISDMVRNGPHVGMVFFVLDERVVADGASGSLTVDSRRSVASFESRLHAPSEIVVAQVVPALATRAARVLAGLQPSRSGERSVSLSSSRLVDLFDITDASAPALAHRWTTHSPRTSVPLGAAMRPSYELDIVDGPHGLVGGKTRSGKTEFLKSFIAALSLANHPDDLAVVVMDFKGGVDYDLVRRLPHVIEVSSNADLDRFERTIAMLSAEQERRQGLFVAAGGANLPAYREARRRRPELPPIPRLVVLVDEFGELMSTEVGKRHLRALESVAHVGGALGLNLVLVTQNFSQALPDLIDSQAGFRVCFRVEQGAQSKVVLGSTIAATISPRNQGRAYVSVSGSAPFEFQSSRVAGRRREIEGLVTAKVMVRRAPLGTLFAVEAASADPDVPSEESDLTTVMDVVAEAARLSGWTESAIPWPDRLASDIPLEVAWRMHGASGDSVPFGVLDLPERQRTDALLLNHDEHLLLLGGPKQTLQACSQPLRCRPVWGVGQTISICM